MRPLLIYFAIFIFNTICYSFNAEGFSPKYNTIKIVSNFENNANKTGFGIVYSVQKDSLIIVTVKNIFEFGSYKVKDIHIQFANEITIRNPSIAYKDSSFNLAVLKVKKPGWFKWDDGLKSETVTFEKLVYILGRYGEWEDYSDRTIGRVMKHGYPEIDIEFTTIRKGCLGTPVVYNDKIAGMVVHDTGNRIFALPIKRIQGKVNTLLDIDINKYILGYPYFLFGAKSNLLLPIRKISPSSSSWCFFSNGFFVELGIFSPISLRFEKNFKNTISSRRLRVFDDYVQSRTEFESFSFFIQYKEGINIQGTYNIFSNAYLGYTRLEQNPMLKINDEPWRDIREFDQVQYRIPERLNTYWVGANFNSIYHNFLVLRFDMGFWYTGPDYILVNPLEPFKKDGAKWHWSVRLDVGFLLYDGKPFRSYIR